MNQDDMLEHYGVKGMKWGVRKDRDPTNTIKEKIIGAAYNTGVQLAPREFKYSVKRAVNRSTETVRLIADSALGNAKRNGKLSTNKREMDAIEKLGIDKHKQAKYNLDGRDLKRLRTYTNAARYSRNINSYLATGEPKAYAARADALKSTLRKTSVSDTTVFRSCNVKFSFDGVAKKLNTMSEEQLAAAFDSFSKNYKGKSFKENRVFSTSTSPNFAIDTWRKVNPTAAKTYNTYMIINTQKCPGLLADGRTTTGKKLVNTRSNQEGILAPSRMKYESLKWDDERKMFAITVTAYGEEDK